MSKRDVCPGCAPLSAGVYKSKMRLKQFNVVFRNVTLCCPHRVSLRRRAPLVWQTKIDGKIVLTWPPLLFLLCNHHLGRIIFAKARALEKGGGLAALTPQRRSWLRDSEEAMGKGSKWLAGWLVAGWWLAGWLAGCGKACANPQAKSCRRRPRIRNANEHGGQDAATNVPVELRTCSNNVCLLLTHFCQLLSSPSHPPLPERACICSPLPPSSRPNR